MNKNNFEQNLTLNNNKLNKNYSERNQTLFNNNFNAINSDSPQTKHNKSLIYNKFHIKKNHHDNNKHVTKSKNYKYIKNPVSISTNIPMTYNDAITCKNKEYWKKAIVNELNNLYGNKIMTYVENVPKGKNVISTRWVFTKKTDEDNNIIKFRARLVARGFSQKEGIDFNHTYSPTLNRLY